MKKIKFHFALFLLLAELLHSLSIHAAIDPTCLPLVKSIEARLAKPAWEQTTITGSASIIIRMAYVNGKSYRKATADAPWSEFPANFNEAEKQMLIQMEKGDAVVSDCTLSEGKVIQGKETQAFHYTVKLQGADAAPSTLYIGKDDNLPYAQESDKTQTTYNYDNIVIP